MSPRGNFMAVSSYDWARPHGAEARPAVTLYEVGSGQIVTTVTHDPVRVEKDRFLGSLIPSFSPDGQYMFTSGLDGTKAWRMLPED